MNPLIFTMWRNSIIFSVGLYAVVFGYVWIYMGSVSTDVVSNAAAGTAGILIGLSFALSGLSYFFNVFDSKLQYRKYLGLMGYYFALAYAISLVFRFPDTYITNFATTIRQPQAILGLIAMTILTCMMIISHTYWMKLLGKHWRPLLRVGYLAYGLLVMRAFLLESHIWLTWIMEPDGLPPTRLVLSVIATGVIAFRLVMEIAMVFFPRPPATKPTTPASTSSITQPVPTPPIS